MSSGRRFGEGRSRFARMLLPITLGALCALALAASGAAAEQENPAGRDGLESAVVDEMLGREEARNAAESFGFSSAERREKTQTHVQRTSEDGEWAFGTAIVEAPKKEGHYPAGWLFVAEKTADGWRVSLDGTSGFDELAGRAPSEVIGENEKDVFAAGTRREFQGTRTRLQLPWKRGLSWKMTGGPHGWSTGYDRPYSALDLAGRGGNVRSAGAGRAVSMCGRRDGWIRVYHPNGYATDYYHLRRNANPQGGKRVRKGTFLGYTGETTCGGGAAYGRHVHFALLRGRDRHVTLNNKTLGGWTFQQGKAYYGYAQRGKVRRGAGSVLRNYG